MSMNPQIHERAIRFDCEEDGLFGVASLPDHPRSTGVLIVVGGPQYRVGSHRQFVLLARSLASAGYATLRFDVRGMGDSLGETRTFEQLNGDIEAAIDALATTCPQVRKVVLWGLCDGASAALLYMHDKADSRVAGLALANPWVRSEASLAKTHVRHYYLQRLRERSFWSKLFSGQIAMAAFAGAASSLRLALRSRGAASRHGTHLSYQERMAGAWQQFHGPLLLLLSSKDYTAREFADQFGSDGFWRGASVHPGLDRVDISGADHTFSEQAHRRCAEEATLAWLGRAGL